MFGRHDFGLPTLPMPRRWDRDLPSAHRTGPHGVSQAMQDFDREMRWRTLPERLPVVRDRSLRGKARIKARKAANRTAS